jgi:hypothetical protein
VSPDAPTYLPYADIHLGLGLSLGFTLESSFTPQVQYQGSSTSKYGGALKWTATRTVLSALPLSLAARVGYSNGKVDWTQPLDSGTVTVGLDSAILETQIAASKMIGAFGFGVEPFIGLGYIKHSSTLSGTGTANLFGSSFPAGTVTTSNFSGSFWGQAGLTLHLYVVALSAEYDNMFGINSYSGKVTFRI